MKGLFILGNKKKEQKSFLKKNSSGLSSAKNVSFVSTLKKAGRAGPQRGSKGEEVTPVPGGGGAGGEVRTELETLIIIRRTKSTSVFIAHPVCLLFPNCLWSLPRFGSPQP